MNMATSTRAPEETTAISVIVLDAYGPRGVGDTAPGNTANVATWRYDKNVTESHNKP